MKKFIKKGILTLMACFTLVICGCSCFNKTKTYSAHGMSITMSDDFYEKNLVSATYYLESSDSIMIAIKEEFQEVLPESTTIEEYTDMVLENNYLNTNINSRANEEYKYFTYEKTVSGKEFFYLATTHKTADAFWLIQFACVEDDKDDFEDKFLEWADSITFDANSEEN